MFFFFQAEDGIRDIGVTGVQTCALPISWSSLPLRAGRFDPWTARLLGLVGADVDAPAGQPSSEASVLPFLADRERQLVVRYDDPRRAGGGVDDLHAADPGR